MVLRLTIGWHFYSEGTKKLEPGFSSAGFLGQAKGPLAGLYLRQLPDGYQWRKLLAVPLASEQLTQEEQADNAAWSADYSRRSAAAGKAGEPQPAELPPHAPAYRDWGENVILAWGQTLKRFQELSFLRDEQRQRAQHVLDRRLRQLTDYLADNEAAIAEYRHEISRIAAWQASAQTGSLPYHDERINSETKRSAALSQSWVRDVDEFAVGLQTDLLRLLDEQQVDAYGPEATISVTEPSAIRLARIDKAVTWLTLGVGGCLLLGFLTPLAACGGALFLLSVMASQPPWVDGAVTEYFYYQLVELIALLTLAAVGAGRWAGLDMFYYACCARSSTASDENASQEASG